MNSPRLNHSMEENIYNYSHYSHYSMNSTIQISKETKRLIGSFGMKEETYEDIILRIYNLAVKEQLREFLMSSAGTLSIEEARKRLNERWPE